MKSVNYKVIFLGSSGVGKSSIIKRFIYNEFDEHSTSTIGAAYFTKTIEKDDINVNYNIWDTAGQEEYDGLIELYYRNTDVSIIVFDITSKKSFNKAKNMVDKVIDFNQEKLILILVGNKTDIDNHREVDIDDALRYAKNIKALYIETSAKNSHNINKLFEEITNKLPIENIKNYYFTQKIKRIPRQIKNKLKLNETEEKKRCCF